MTTLVVLLVLANLITFISVSIIAIFSAYFFYRLLKAELRVKKVEDFSLAEARLVHDFMSLSNKKFKTLEESDADHVRVINLIADTVNGHTLQLAERSELIDA